MVAAGLNAATFYTPDATVGHKNGTCCHRLDFNMRLDIMPVTPCLVTRYSSPGNRLRGTNREVISHEKTGVSRQNLIPINLAINLVDKGQQPNSSFIGSKTRKFRDAPEKTQETIEHGRGR
jgi:hypothetical protein